MKQFYRTLLLFVIASAMIACSDKKKSDDNTDKVQQDSCQVANRVVVIEPCTAQSAVYDLDFDTIRNIQIDAKIENGKVFVSISKENAKKLFVRNGDNDSRGYDIDFEVEGLEGNCKALFWGNWGQEVNPLLCMLMDDGGVEILDINNAISNYNFLSSGRLPQLENIVAFKLLGEGGSSVVAIDANGNDHDIVLFHGTSGVLNLYEKEVNYTLHHYLELSPDWKIAYDIAIEDADGIDGFEGRFRGKCDIGDNEKVEYTFEICKAFKYDEKSEIGYSMKESHGTGSFTMKKLEDGGMGEDFEIVVTSGNIKFARLVDKPRYGYRDVNPFSYKAEE